MGGVIGGMGSGGGLRKVPVIKAGLSGDVRLGRVRVLWPRQEGIVMTTHTTDNN